MKSTLLVAILFLVTLATALWLLGVFEPAPDAPPVAPTPTPAAAPPDLAPPDLAESEPRAEPAPDVPEVPAVVRVMVLGESPRSFTMWLPILWKLEPRIQWQMWLAESAASSVQTHADSVPPLAGKPTASDLDAVGVLVLAGVDPARFDDAFWARVAEKVKAKSLGLLVLAEHRFARAYAEHAALKDLLPVRGVKPVAPIAPGSQVIAGVFDEPKRFVVTDAGRRHPASRIVPYPGWSVRHWDAQAGGTSGWTTKFVAPAEGPAADAAVLVEVDTGAGRVPAFLASSGEGARVLWIGGFFDLERPAYSGSAAYDRARALAVAWVAWLAGLIG